MFTLHLFLSNPSNSQEFELSSFSLCEIVNMSSAQAETGTGECGTGYAYFCGYFYGIDHPDFYAYEGPWIA